MIYPDNLISLLEKEECLINMSPNRKDIFIDKCCFLCDTILRKYILGKRNKGYFVNIHSDYLKKYLSFRDYKSVISLLEKVKVIKVNNKCSVGRFSKSYSINPKLSFKIIEADPRSKKFQNILSKRINHNRNKELNNDLFKKTSIQLKRIRVWRNPMHWAVEAIDFNHPNNTNQMKLYRYQKSYFILKKLNKTQGFDEVIENEFYFSPTISRSGRFYHFMAFVPKKIRHLLCLEDFSPIWEVDMASAQLTLLFLQWIKEEPHHKEKDLCINLISNAGVYNYIGEKSLYFNKYDYAGLKKEILSIINDKTVLSSRYFELKKLFPNFINWLDRIKKREGYKKVSYLAQKAESDLFIGLYKELDVDFFLLPIHDCFLTTEKNKEYIRDMIVKKFIRIYPDIIPPEKLNNLFRIEKVTHIDESHLTRPIKLA